jgi:hypothetical protein
MNAINYLKQLKELHSCKASSNRPHLLKEINGEAKEILKTIRSNWILNILKQNHNNCPQF